MKPHQRIALVVILGLPMACNRNDRGPAPVLRAVAPAPTTEAIVTPTERGRSLVVGDARWNVLSVTEERRSHHHRMLLAMEVTNLSNHPASIVLTPVLIDDKGGRYIAAPEASGDDPSTARPMLAEDPCGAGQTRTLRFLYALPPRRSVAALELPGISSLHGTRILDVTGVNLSALAQNR